MPTCFLKRVLPFTLTLILGVISWQLLHLNETAKIEQTPFYYDGTGLTILSVPDLDFTHEARQTNGFSGMARLTASFGPDGTVGTINPVLILPDGMTEKEYVSRNHETPTSARLNGKAVEYLPYGMTEALQESISRIKFTPAIRDGKTHFVWLSIVAEFNLIKSPDCIECSSITVTISDRDGIKWNKETNLPNAYRKKEY
jgi:hypothetical protein